MHRFKPLALWFLLLTTLSLWFLPRLAPDVAGRFIFISLAAIPLLIADGVAFVLLLKKRNWWSICFGALLLACLPCMASYVPFHPSRHTADGHPFRLISWNAEGFQLSRVTLAEAADYLNSQQPDLICIQERPHHNLLAWDTIQAAFPNHPYRAINSREDEVLNLAFISRWPIKNIKEYYFPDSYNKMLRADVNIKGRFIRVFNVHLQTTGAGTETSHHSLFRILCHNAAKRNRQARLLAQAIKESPFPVIVCGDFNDTPSSYAYRILAPFLHDSFLQAGHGWGGSYQPFGGLFRIDYTLCSQSCSIENYKLVSNAWSDHKIQETNLRIHFSPDE